MVLLVLLVSALIPPAIAQTITVSTNKASYLPDELVTISGVADANAWVAVDVKNPQATSVFIDSVQANTLGAYSTAFRLSIDVVEGTYTVYVSAPGATDSTTFIVSLVPTGDTGTLIVDTTPIKGAVVVDGTSWGIAPQTRVLAVGAHTVSFGVMSGYTKPADQIAVVTKDTPTPITGIYVLITADMGTLSVDTTPVKGAVFVGGVSWGIAPQSRVVAVGSYTVSYGAFAGYTKPSPVSALVTKDTPTTKMGTYVWIPAGFGVTCRRHPN